MRYLYHASYSPYQASILRWGLGGAPSMPRPNWEDSRKGVVYLASTPEQAASYAETSDAVPADWLDHIVVFEVDTRCLQPALLDKAPNVRGAADALTFAYLGMVPAQALRLVPATAFNHCA